VPWWLTDFSILQHDTHCRWYVVMLNWAKLCCTNSLHSCKIITFYLHFPCNLLAETNNFGLSDFLLFLFLAYRKYPHCNSNTGHSFRVTSFLKHFRDFMVYGCKILFKLVDTFSKHKRTYVHIKNKKQYQFYRIFQQKLLNWISQKFVPSLPSKLPIVTLRNFLLFYNILSSLIKFIYNLFSGNNFIEYHYLHLMLICLLFKILLSDPKNLDKSAAYDMLKPWLGTGLITSTGK
jgi:hypothetical protein